jgi:hypothetical protein
MLRYFAASAVVVCASFFSTPASFAQSTRPTDAKSYCEKLKSIPGLPEYARGMIKSAQATAAVAKENREIASRFLSHYSLGVDDPQRSLSKKIVERINVAVPKKDAYNQDASLAQYMNWFVSCASSLRTEQGLSPASVVFLNPHGQEASKFYAASPEQRVAVLQEVMGPSGLGGLNARSIEAQTGLPFVGMNPRWVLPIAIAMEGSESFLPAYIKKAVAASDALVQASQDVVQQTQAIASGTHAACQRIENSEVVKRLVRTIKSNHDAQVNNDQMGALVALRLDNNQGDLTALIKRRMLDAAGGPKADIGKQGQLLSQYNKVIENCAVKNVGNDLFLFFAANASMADRVQEQREQTQRGQGNLLNYDGKKPRTIDAINPMWASLYLFMFEDSEKIATQNGNANADALVAQGEDIRKQRIRQQAEAESEKYAGLRRLYAFSQTPELLTVFNKCIAGEHVYQGKIADRLQAAAKEANTVSEQKSYVDAANFRKQNINVFAAAMCLYRLNFGLVMIETKNPGIAMMLGADTKDLGRENPTEKYTAKAMPEIAKYMAMSPESFYEGVMGKYLQDTNSQLEQTQVRTRRQAEQVRTGKAIVGLASQAAEEAILGSLVEPMIAAKHLP